MVVLLVSDSLEASQIATALRRQGHQVHRAGTGVGALSSGVAQLVDVMVCDLELADMPGLDVVRAFRLQYPNLPVVVLTDELFTDGSIVDLRVLQKPVAMEALAEELRFIARSRAELSVVLVDADAIHAARVATALQDLGCSVERFVAAAQALAHVQDHGQASLLLVDAALPGVEQLTSEARGRGIVVIAYVSKGNQLSHDALLRLGAALVMSKPVDCRALLSQARFLALR